MTGVPYAPTMWDEIIPNLFQGGHVWVDDRMHRWVTVADEFDLVLSLYSRAGAGPSHGVEHHVTRMPDGYLVGHELDDIRRFADLAVAAVQTGRRVLVRCEAGYNRSGLVVAFTLLRLGYSAQDAIELIRAKRSPHALCNGHFVTYIFAEAVRLERANAEAVT